MKVWLLFGEKRVDKKKTPIYKCNLNPTFNQVKSLKINVSALAEQIFGFEIKRNYNIVPFVT